MCGWSWWGVNCGTETNSIGMNLVMVRSSALTLTLGCYYGLELSDYSSCDSSGYRLDAVDKWRCLRTQSIPCVLYALVPRLPLLFLKSCFAASCMRVPIRSEGGTADENEEFEM